MDPGSSTPRLRLWPGIAAVVLLWLSRYGVPLIVPESVPYAVGGAALCALAVLVWWLFFSRAPQLERWGALALLVAGLAATAPFIHPSVAGGMMGLMFVMYSVPLACLALVAWAAVTRNWSPGPRRAALVATVLLLCGGWLTVRTDGISGEGQAQFAWRWTPSAEEQLVARVPSLPPPAPPKIDTPAPVRAKEALPAVKVEPPLEVLWAGFRGAQRDAVIRGARIDADWSKTPPVEVWRKPVGPGWSSFAAGGGLIFTQEQRGDYEVVACYRLATGEPVWMHQDKARFWESNGGPGPRGTPLLHDGRIYSLGATGILNVLNARDGSLVWTRSAAADTGAKIPGWGYTSSPLVVNDAVIVATSGRVAAYDLASGGKPRWVATTGGGSYASPHLATFDGVAQIVMLNGSGAAGIAPDDGKVLWKHAWEGSPILQPVALADGELLINTADASGGIGTRRLAVKQSPGGWTVEEKWTSRGLKPYFNDLVVHKGFAFGFDGGILSCVDVQDGQRKWKGGRYGHGQMILLAEQDLLLVLSEEGEVALVSAKPDGFSEVARFKAIEGKTWNHPALAGDLLLVRNGEEMAAFRVSRRGS